MKESETWYFDLEYFDLEYFDLEYFDLEYFPYINRPKESAT